MFEGILQFDFRKRRWYVVRESDQHKHGLYTGDLIAIQIGDTWGETVAYEPGYLTSYVGGLILEDGVRVRIVAI